MTMTKKEQAEVDALRQELAVAKAMRFTAKVDPDIAPPSGPDSTSGWLYNCYTMRTEQAWSMSVMHGRGGPDRKSTGSGSQGARWLYSSQLLALKAMRHEMEMDFAEKLASVDSKIEEEQGACK